MFRWWMSCWKLHVYSFHLLQMLKGAFFFYIDSNWLRDWICPLPPFRQIWAVTGSNCIIPHGFTYLLSLLFEIEKLYCCIAFANLDREHGSSPIAQSPMVTYFQYTFLVHISGWVEHHEIWNELNTIYIPIVRLSIYPLLMALKLWPTSRLHHMVGSEFHYLPSVSILCYWTWPFTSLNYLLKMVIFHSCYKLFVCVPEANTIDIERYLRSQRYPERSSPGWKCWVLEPW
jgi:hypothetical protein